MLNRDARARRRAQPRATLRRSLGVRERNGAGRRLDLTTKEEGDWPSTGGEETDWILPERDFFLFQISTASCVEHFVFLGRGRRGTDWH